MARFNLAAPGMVVTAQLGNPGDHSWTPNAPMLLIAIEGSHFQGLRYYGVTKEDNGTIWINLGVMQGRAAEPMEGEEAEEGSGEFYSTAALNYTDGQYKRYMSAKQREIVEDALVYHTKRVDALATHTRVFRQYA
jgi:hypothetical protein